MTRRILALDIGTGAAGSGFVDFETSATKEDPVCAGNTRILECGIVPNEEIKWRIPLWKDGVPAEVVFEMISSQGNRQGRDIHRTLLWIGLLSAVVPSNAPPPCYVLARTAAAHVAEMGRAGDKQVAQAVRDRFCGVGATPSQAKGKKGSPGPLYGFKGHIYRAAATGIAYVEGCRQEHPWEPR